MRSSSRNAKVNRKPLFKCRTSAEESPGDGRIQDTSDISRDKKRSKIGGQALSSGCKVKTNTCSKRNDVISVASESPSRKISKNCNGDKETRWLAGLGPGTLDESSEKVNSNKQLNIKRKKPARRNESLEIIQKDILNECEESMWVNSSALEKNAILGGNVSEKSSDRESIVNTCSHTSTPHRMPTSQSESSDLFHSLSELSSLGEGSQVAESSEFIMDCLDVDDSELAAIDMSNIISSYDSARCQLNSETCNPVLQETSTASENLGMQDKQQLCGNPTEKALHSNADICSTEKGIRNDSGVRPKEETNQLFYGLPLNVANLIKKYKGIEELYDWQKDCLNLPGLQRRENLIYSLPTSGGKTLVAEILIMKELLCHGRDAILILPFVSIVQEKVRDLSLFAVDLEFLVEEYASSKGKYPPRKRRKTRSLYVATIEKANGLVNSLIEETRLSEIGLVVVDELHMLGEGGQRGATLEMCLAKILFCSSSTQVIGMSATLNNIADLQRFLNAEKYTNDFRPVELREFFKIEDEIFEVKKDKIGRNEEIPFKRFRRIKHKTKDTKVIMNDPDHLCLLAQEVVPDYSCLIFCPTKMNCQNVAKLLAETLPKDIKKVKFKEKYELARALKSIADRLCPVLRRVIPYGIAYHHSGLTMDERKLIEEAYSQGTLCLLTCTSTLAAGVNLPAKRVILRSPYVGRNVISRSQYKQMTGRAGRAGFDTTGESILILNKKEKDKIMGLVNAPLESCHSSLLHNNGQGLRSLVLSLIGLKVCNSLEEVKNFISGTLLSVQNNSQGNTTFVEKILENIEALVRVNLVKKWECAENGTTVTRVETTCLGRATFKGCVDVDRSPFIYDELKRAQESLVLANDLHLLYLVTTPEMIENIQPSWMTYLTEVSSLNAVEQKAAEFIGITEGYLSRKVSGYGSKKTEKEISIVKRFYLTLVLYKIIHEHSLWDVANTFDLERGFIQSLFSSSSTFASSLVHFTKELPEFHNIRLLLETIVDKLTYTAVLELVPLMQIPGVKKSRAKQLFSAGYRNLQAVAKSDASALVKDIEHLSRTQAQVLVSSAKMLLLEKAEALQEEAADLIEA